MVNGHPFFQLNYRRMKLAPAYPLSRIPNVHRGEGVEPSSFELIHLSACIPATRSGRALFTFHVERDTIALQRGVERIRTSVFCLQSRSNSHYTTTPRKVISMITQICETCNQNFQAESRELNRGNARFCSLKCSANRQRSAPTPNCTCSTCGADLYRSPSRLRASKSGHQFCNRACKEMAQRIGGIKEIQPPHYGTVFNDYRVIAKRNLKHECFNCGYDRHIEVLEVHHLNMDHSDNRLDNLAFACPTCHNEIHFLDKSGKWGKRSTN